MPQALPARNIFDGTALPSTSTMKTALGQLRDYLNETLGPTGGVFTAGLRNRFINGGMAIDQRNGGAAQTITAGAALAYTVDRWYAYCTGANVTGQRVAGSGTSQYRYQFTGAASNTKIGFAQRIEAANSYDLNGRAITVAVDLANSLLTTVTWTAWYANTADTFGTLASPTRTSIGTGTVTVTSTPTRYYIPITLPAAATTGIEIEFSVGAQVSGTWTIGEAQLVAGSASELWREQRPIGMELALCQRYYQEFRGGASGFANGTTSVETGYVFPVAMRTSPTLAAGAGLATINWTGGASVNPSSISVSNSFIGSFGASLRFNNYTGLTSGQGVVIQGGGSAYATFSAEL